MEKETYTVKEIAKKLGIGMNKAYELVNQKQIPSIKIGKKYLIPRKALAQWIDRCLQDAMQYINKM